MKQFDEQLLKWSSVVIFVCTVLNIATLIYRVFILPNN
jgi:hypothetical protein